MPFNVSETIQLILLDCIFGRSEYPNKSKSQKGIDNNFWYANKKIKLPIYCSPVLIKPIHHSQQHIMLFYYWFPKIMY